MVQKRIKKGDLFMGNVYSVCPTFEDASYFLRFVTEEDAKDRWRSIAISVLCHSLTATIVTVIISIIQPRKQWKRL